MSAPELAKLHVVYSLLLAHCFSLAEEDVQLVHKHWECSPFSADDGGEAVHWPNVSLSDVLPNRGKGMNYKEVSAWLKAHPLEAAKTFRPIRPPEPLKICSMPSELEKLTAASDLAQLFDLEGVPGFFRDTAPLPGPGSILRRMTTDDWETDWRINLPYASGSGLLAPYDNGTGYIVGIRIYLFTAKRQAVQSSFLRAPFLLSSRGLTNGAPAIACREDLVA